MHAYECKGLLRCDHSSDCVKHVIVRSSTNLYQMEFMVSCMLLGYIQLTRAHDVTQVFTYTCCMQSRFMSVLSFSRLMYVPPIYASRCVMCVILSVDAL